MLKITMRVGGPGYSFILKMNWSNISVQKLESERSKSFAVCISLQTKAIKVSLGAPGLENIPQIPANRAKDAQNHDARRRSRLLCYS